jgi:melibiose permease
VVKLASGVAAFVAGIVLQICNISKDTETEVAGEIAQGSRMGLRMSMTIIPIIVLAFGLVVFTRKYILTDEKLAEISAELETRRKA